MKKIIKLLLHQDFSNPNHKDHKKATIIATAILVLSCFYVFYCVYYLLKFPISYQQNTNNFIGLICFLIFFILLKKSKKIKYPVMFINLSTLPLMYSSIYIRGGIYSADIAWMCLTIISTILFIDRWFGVFCTIVSFLFLAFLYFTTFNSSTINKEFLNFVQTEGSFHYFFTWSFVFGLMTAIMLSFSITLQKTTEKLDAISESKIANLEEQLTVLTNNISLLRKTISQDFHDEMGNKLATIGIMAAMLDKKMEQNCAREELTPLLEQISEKSKEVFEGTKDFIWTIDWKNDFVIELYYYIASFAENFLTIQNINVSTSININDNNKTRISPTTSRQLIYICKELFTNAFKHANCTEVVLEFIIQETGLLIEISDNGIGFDFENTPKRGVNNIKTRCQKINAVYKYQSGFEYTGTKFSMLVNF